MTLASPRLCGPRPPLLLCLTAAIALAVFGTAIRPSPAAATDEQASHRQADPPYPWAERMAATRGYARTRRGRIAFAVVDESGRVHGQRLRAPFLSASLVKAMLLVAYLDRPAVARRALDARERKLLAPMITRSDNDVATAVRNIVGNGGLRRVAAAAGMRDFAPARSWGSSRVTAGDQARFFFRIDRLVPERHRDYVRRLLSSVVPRQRWGIPRVSPPGWDVFFKGGWRPTGGWTVNQAALLERPPRRLAVAVLTDRGRSFAYGRATVRGVAARLLHGYGELVPGRRKVHSARTVAGADASREHQLDRVPGPRAELLHGDLALRAIRGVHFRSDRTRHRRHQRQRGHLRARSVAWDNAPGERGLGRAPRPTRAAPPGDQRGRPPGGLGVRRLEPGGWRPQRAPRARKRRNAAPTPRPAFDAFVRDLKRGTTRDNLVRGDTNDTTDVLVRGPLLPEMWPPAGRVTDLNGGR